ncbi:hypothetical protein SteCoe_22091 [Stentor coeruleus]|uniref:Uncharacterized protein n=1 Tax=Stentor coeruleus TaxID=5963 RepID=A0A1R2BMZ9_9CILI|nr:hypothetical protein SteCoe_22091 [Stentor coeruleus]
MIDRKNIHSRSSSSNNGLGHTRKISSLAPESISPSISSKDSTRSVPVKKGTAGSSKIPICSNCLKFMQQEVRLIQTLSSLASGIQNFITGIQEWKNANLNLPSALELGIKDLELNNDFESSRKFVELCKGIEMLGNLTVGIAKNVNNLAKTSPWECVKKKVEIKSEEGVMECIKKAKECLYGIQGKLMEENAPVQSANSLVQALNIQLMQSKRERRALEVLVKTSGSGELEKVQAVLDNLLANK